MTELVARLESITNSQTHQVHRVRRLGLDDLGILADIFAKAQVNLLRDQEITAKMNPEGLMLLLTTQFPQVKDLVYDFMGQILDPKVSGVDLHNPDVWALEDAGQVIEALVSHRDAVAFFGSIRRILERLGMGKGDGQRPSPTLPMSSKRGTGGRTRS